MLLLFHGDPEASPQTGDIRNLMAGNEQLYVLFINEPGVRPADATASLGKRAFGFNARVAAFRDWDAHPKAVRTKLKAFVDECRKPETQVPPWSLLGEGIGPAGPEHILACLLAALAARPDVVPDEWRENFENEVAELRDRGVKRDLSWRSREDAEELRAFLLEAGTLEEYRG